MVHLIVQASKYLMIILFMIYTFECFHVFKYEGDVEEQKHIYGVQRGILFVIHFDAFLVLYLTTGNVQMIGFYLMQLVLLVMMIGSYHLLYKQASELVLNNMCMLLAIGFIILTRLSFEKAFRQFIFVCAGMFIGLLIPLVLRNMSLFRKLTWIYAILGIGALAVVAVAGQTSYGAKLSISVGGISIQPSEFVKIIFVMFIASMLYRRQDFHQLVVTSVVSAVFVLALVASKDLGGALLYFFTYLVMIYVATRKFAYFGAGLGLMTVAALVGYKIFSHVQTRVLAWSDPLAVIDNAGYQICQSLFAIGTGGWFGLGLNQGMPNKIPVVSKDFVFAAISEEMGGVFALCLIMVCVSCFFMIMNVAMLLKDNFYRLTAVGLGTLYALQVFLTIGGVIKFIPSTGVTLPLVSYGGSSLLSTMIVFGMIQGLYIANATKEKENIGNRKKRKQKRRQRDRRRHDGRRHGRRRRECDTQRRPPQCRRERQRPQPLFWQRQDHHARKRQPLRQDLSEPRDGKERKRAAAQQRTQFDRHKYQWNLERCALPADAVERPRARHGRLFVRRRKYALQHLKVKKAGAACSRLAFAVLTNRIHLDIMKYNRKEVSPYGS